MTSPPDWSRRETRYSKVAAGCDFPESAPFIKEMLLPVRLPLFSCFLLAALPGSVGAAPATIVVFGDSTTAEDSTLTVYGRLLEESLNARSPGAVKVVNAGVRGDTTAAAALRFESDILPAAPDLVVIQFGINDATIDVWKQPPATGPRVELAGYRANLAGFIAALRARGVRVVLMTPNPLSWTPRLVELYGHPPYDPRDPAGLNINLARYAAAMRELATETQVPLVDIWQAHQAERGTAAEPLLSDGMHPNARGHTLVARLLAGTIVTQQLLPGTASR
jgi:lysophospholipase L1-like esterase